MHKHNAQECCYQFSVAAAALLPSLPQLLLHTEGLHNEIWKTHRYNVTIPTLYDPTAHERLHYSTLR